MQTFFIDGDDALEQIRSGKLSHAEIALAIDVLAKDNKSSVISEQTGISATNVRHYLRLARKLDREVLERLHSKAISPSIARALAGLPPPEQRDQARRITLIGTSVHSLRAQIAGKPDLAKAKQESDSHYRRLSEYLGERTGLAISIDPDSKATNAGTLKIKFTDAQDFDVIVSRLRDVAGRKLDMSEL